MKKRILAVLAAALVALPVLARQPTPTPVAQQPQKAEKGRVLQQQGKEVQPTVTPTPSAERGKPTKEQRGTASDGPDTTIRQQRGVTPTPSVERGKPTKEQKSAPSDRVARPTMKPTPTI